LWGAFVALAALATLELALTLTVMQIGKRQEYTLVHSSAPLMDAVRTMDQDVTTILAASRGYVLTHQTQLQQQYDDGVREFEKASGTAVALSSDPRDLQLVSDLHHHFTDIKSLCDEQIRLTNENKLANAQEFMLEAAKSHRAAQDYAGMMEMSIAVARHARSTR